MQALRNTLTAFINAAWMKPVRAAGLLAAGKSAQAVLSIIYLALAARALGPEMFGTLVLIHSLILAVAKMARFQTWQALIHYGAKAEGSNDTPRLCRMIKFSCLLDTLSALAAYGLILVISSAATGWFGIDSAHVSTFHIYGLVVLFMVMNGTPTGILQLYDRFDRIAWQTAVAPFIRFVGTLYLFFNGGTLMAFLAVWFIAEIVAILILMACAVMTLKAQSLWPALTNKSDNILRPETGIWRYVGGTSLASTLDLSTTHLPVLFTGWLLGPAAAGIFRIAKQFASIIMKPSTKLFGRAIYPDLARQAAQDDRETRRVMMGKTAALTGALAAIVFFILTLVGKPLITITAGSEYIAAYAPMLWLAASGIIGALAFALEPMLIASGAIRQTVLVRLFVTILFLPALYYLLLAYGVVGAGMAAVLYAFLSGALMLWAGRHLLFNNRKNYRHA